MTVKFLRVNGIRSHQPAVVAIVDNTRVKWHKNGWACDCDAWTTGAEGDSCQHVDAVAELLDPRVTGETG